MIATAAHKRSTWAAKAIGVTNNAQTNKVRNGWKAAAVAASVWRCRGTDMRHIPLAMPILVDAERTNLLRLEFTSKTGGLLAELAGPDSETLISVTRLGAERNELRQLLENIGSAIP